MTPEHGLEDKNQAAETAGDERPSGPTMRRVLIVARGPLGSLSLLEPILEAG